MEEVKKNTSFFCDVIDGPLAMRPGKSQRGRQVKFASFTDQFKGKGPDDPIWYRLPSTSLGTGRRCCFIVDFWFRWDDNFRAIL